MHLIRMSAPTSEDSRLADTLRDAGGFVYHIMLAGTTGAELPDEDRIARALAKVRAHTGLPVAAGFGVRTPKQARVVGRHADRWRSVPGWPRCWPSAACPARWRKCGCWPAPCGRVAARHAGRPRTRQERGGRRRAVGVHAVVAHVRVGNPARLAQQPVTDPEGQEQRDRQIGGDHADPVDALFRRPVVLAQRHQQAQHEGQQRAEGEQAGQGRSAVS